MIKVIKLSLCTCLLLFTATSTVMAKPKPLSAWETGRQFYLWTLRHPGKGLPYGPELAPIKPLLSPELNQLLQQTEVAEGLCQKATPQDQKAPFAEGDFFVNHYEGATVLNRLKVVQQEKDVLLEADLVYVDKRFPPGHRHHAYRWSDRLALAQFSGQWRVTDVQFKDRPSLAAMLKDYARELKKCAGQ
ncbi:MAG: hypothetical protein AB7I41_10690 [Candidatus Sericytochromatia bacterium]